MTTPVKMFVAVKAFIVNDGKVLVIRGTADGTDVRTKKYEIVGGRIEPCEQYEDALHREVNEEVGLEVEIIKPFAVGEWFPVIGGEQCHVVAIFFECRVKSGSVTLGTDHDDFKWIDPKDVGSFPLMENLRPVFAKYCAQ